MFRVSTAGISLHFLFMCRTAMRWWGTTLPEPNKALYSHASGSALWYMAVLPWVKSFYMKMQRRQQEKAICHSYWSVQRGKKSSWGTTDRATTLVSFPTLLATLSSGFFEDISDNDHTQLATLGSSLRTHPCFFLNSAMFSLYNIICWESPHLLIYLEKGVIKINKK